MLHDLHLLPKIRDSISMLYVEHARVEREESAIALYTQEGKAPVPAASLAVLMLGPGTTITQAAVRALAENDCLVVWCGEENVRFYAFGTGGTRSAAPLLYQARMASSESLRLVVVRRMYAMRFGGQIPATSSLEALRGMEAARFRETYQQWSRQTGVPWSGRSYDRNNWAAGDLPNRALSAANACLYGICHAAILAAGFSPALGFIHTGKQLSFVYDVADFYKTLITIPVAFKSAAENPSDIERTVRLRCRDAFRETRLLQRIIPDIKTVLGLLERTTEDDFPADEDPALPTPLWSPSDEEGG